ncbi:MAG: ABC transporter permease [Phycisphaerae bacterium]
MTGPRVQIPDSAARRATLQGVWRSPFFTAVLALVLVLILGLIFSGEGAFYKWSTHRDALRQASVFGVLACGMTVVIITAGIDLSVGSVLALTAVSFSILCVHWGWSAWLAIPVCLLIGTCCGMATGSLIARFAIQPFVVTLAMMVFARGLAKYVSGGMKVSQSIVIDEQPVWLELPRIFSMIDSRLLAGNISVVTLIFFACVAVSWILLSRLRWGRYLYAIGGNEPAARLSGVPVGAMKLLAYGLSGFFAGVAGICQAAQETQGDPEAGVAYELSAIAIVVIGGTSLMGGRGGIGLTLLGTLIIGYIDKILSINAVAEASRLMLTGTIIVVAVLVQRRRA